MRWLLGSVLIVCLNALVPLAFDVATVKINKTYSGFSNSSALNGKFAGTNLALTSYIRMAYGVNDFQVVGPDWINHDRFDIAAIAPGGTTPDQMMAMLRSLLADRFQLQIHRETRTVSAYGLAIAKSGLKIKEVNAPADGATNNGSGNLIVHHASMDRFAEVLSRQTERPVIDQTGRSGVFDFNLKWSLDDTGPSIFTAIQEQLGLKLNPGKYPLEFIVVDHALRVPVEN